MARAMDVVEYTENWNIQFENEKQILLNIMKDIILEVHHFGSTSVRGLIAKPIIDIMAFVKNIEDVDKYNECMEKEGYISKGENGEVGRRYFVKMKDDNSGNHLVHIHIYYKGHKKALDELTFRDYLRINADAREKYAICKLKLSQQYYYEPSKYTNGKSQCILEILNEAKTHFDKFCEHNN